jgi:hypothetical protein
MRRWMVTLVFLSCLVAVPLFAQSNPEIDKILEGMDQGKKAVTTSEMKLTVEEEKFFWPLYEEYQTALRKVETRSFKWIVDYGKELEKETFTDEKAQAFVSEYLDIAREELELKKAYVEKFSKGLSPKKVMRYFQLENKAYATMNYQLTRMIPLAK